MRSARSGNRSGGLAGQGLRLGRGFTRARRAQVILVAVMVLFGVATLAALFIGILGAQIVQVTRYTDVTALRAIAEAGLRFANHNLLYSKDGADWRPRLLSGTQEPLPVLVDGKRGLVRVRVTYGPTPTDLQSRYLLISATATFADDPFSSYTILGVKPLLLTDYARCITDRYELNRPAALGVAGVEARGDTRSDYRFSIIGGIHSNTDLVWYGPSQVRLATPDGLIKQPPGPGVGASWSDLGILRDDRIEVAGAMRPGVPTAIGAASFPAISSDTILDANPLRLFLDYAGYAWVGNVFKPLTLEEQACYRLGFPLVDNLIPRPNSWRLLAELPAYLGPDENNPSDDVPSGACPVSRIRPPRVDALEPDLQTNRYLVLTRDSGRWQSVGGNYVNPGAWGWGWAYGGGIYIDNDRDDIQYGHDLERLRQNWVGSYAEPGADGRADGAIANWWDKTGRYYAPPGAEIVLHGEAACPYIEITRGDLRTVKGVLCAWQDIAGNPIPLDGSPYVYAAQSGMCQPTAQSPWGRIDVDGTPQRQITRALFPFPPNGVIYAEGNVRVRGLMPPSRHARANMPYFDSDYNATADWGRSRRYDLQIVSGGTIYIEGDLLTPVTAGFAPNGMTDAAELLRWDMLNGSRVALLARDSVCLNTTALQPRPQNMFVRGADGTLSESSFNDFQRLYPEDPVTGFPAYPLFTVQNVGGEWQEPAPSDDPVPTFPPSITYVYRNVRFGTRLEQDLTAGRLGLLLGHSAWYRKDGDPSTSEPSGGGAEESGVEVQLTLNGSTVPWPGEQDHYTFITGTPNLAQSLSDHWYRDGDRVPIPWDGTTDYLEYLFRPGRQYAGDGAFAYQLTGDDTFTFTPTLFPAWNHDTDNPQWIVPPHQLGYVLGPVAAAAPRGQPPLPVRIEALVYAQNGSWFVLPGPWFDEDPNERSDDPPASPYPAYHEPLNVQIQFYGAITENMPAPIGDVADWTSKWAGALGAEAARYGPYLSYEYDPLLRSPRWEATGVCPRFPHLPLSPDLLIWGERLAGFSTAGI